MQDKELLQRAGGKYFYLRGPESIAPRNRVAPLSPFAPDTARKYSSASATAKIASLATRATLHRSSRARRTHRGVSLHDRVRAKDRIAQSRSRLRHREYRAVAIVPMTAPIPRPSPRRAFLTRPHPLSANEPPVRLREPDSTPRVSYRYVW